MRVWGINIYTLSYTKEIISKNILYYRDLYSIFCDK